MTKKTNMIDKQGEVRELTGEDRQNFRPAAELLPEVVKAYKKGRGIQKGSTKVRITIRLDADIVQTFRHTGPGWQGRLNEALRDSLHQPGAKHKPVKRTSNKLAALENEA